MYVTVHQTQLVGYIFERTSLDIAATFFSIQMEFQSSTYSFLRTFSK